MTRAEEFTEDKSRIEAASWFVKIKSGDASDEDLQEHQAWLNAQEQNRREYAELSMLWSNLDDVEDPRDQFAPANLVTVDNSLLSRRRFIVGGAIAASAATFIAVKSVSGFLTEGYTTSIGEQRNITLADGSQVMMDADSSIELAFSESERRILLLRGRVFFDVAKDKNRPLIVEASEGSVKALGTRFTVHCRNDDVTVFVEESAVVINAPNGEKIEVRERESISYNSHTLSRVTIDATGIDKAWRNGKLIFEDQPLRQVIADLNRYRSGMIYITDSSLFELKVSGIFDINDLGNTLEAIGNSLPVKIKKMPFNVILLHPTERGWLTLL